ncbi:MAG: thermonuclease family protein [Cyanophyceae cyanobacterium]
MKTEKLKEAGVALLFSCLLGLVACQPQSPEGTVAEVQRVVSGQTIEVLIPSQAPATIERVRLLDIAAPDLQQQPWGVAAKELLAALLGDQQGTQLVLQSVVLQWEGAEDRFGRRLAYVWRDNTLINEELVAQGYALADVRSDSPNSQRLIRAQETARIMGYGIWNPENPLRLTPQEFRSQNNGSKS